MHLRLTGESTSLHGRIRSVLHARFAADGVVLCGSGTQALQLAIAVARRDLDERAGLALPAFGCFDLATAAVASGSSVCFYDLDPATLAPDVCSLEGALAAGARVVVIAYLYGHPIPWDEIRSVADRHSAILIEDAAQGDGGTWRGSTLGSLASLSVVSFGRGKGWTGCGGGALLIRGHLAATVDRDFVDPGRWPVGSEARLAAMAVAQCAFGRPALYGLPRVLPWLHLGETIYRQPGVVTAMSPLAAGILVTTRESADTEARRRRARARTILARLAFGFAVRGIAPPTDGEAGYLRLPVRVRYGMAGFPDARRAERLGVAPSYPSLLPDLPALAKTAPKRARGWPGAEALVRELVTLPTHSLLTESELDQLVQEVDRYSRSVCPNSSPAGAPVRQGT